MKRLTAIEIPDELREVDEACKIWARVTGDAHTAVEANVIYRMMLLYGDKENRRLAAENRVVPLSRDEIALGWKVQNVWQALPLPHQNILLLWYFSPIDKPQKMARALKISMLDLRCRLFSALNTLKVVLFGVDNRKM